MRMSESSILIYLTVVFLQSNFQTRLRHTTSARQTIVSAADDGDIVSFAHIFQKLSFQAAFFIFRLSVIMTICGLINFAVEY